jgi:heterodisulfide reductase subunit C
MDELRQKAKELLETNAVQLIIGYEQGSGNQSRAAFISIPDQADRLIFDSRCIQNLATYITRPDMKRKGRVALVAPLPVLRSLIQLASENQIGYNDLVILGISPESKLLEFSSFGEIESYLAEMAVESNEKQDAMLRKIKDMSREERLAFWVSQLSPCFKCYACRAACPMCYCTRCTVDSNQPQWVPVASHALGNLEWHIMRAMHLAGRCVNCDACANVCPLGIPLNLLTRNIMEEIGASFGEKNSNQKDGNILSIYNPNDKENFIR